MKTKKLMLTESINVNIEFGIDVKVKVYLDDKAGKYLLFQGDKYTILKVVENFENMYKTYFQNLKLIHNNMNMIIEFRENREKNVNIFFITYYDKSDSVYVKIDEEITEIETEIFRKVFSKNTFDKLL